ncbi:phosphotransferase [Burkholderia gladioli]|uniref:phosphotransferase n=1 Tax=Burkholderia gladioli TaxID=28095 RepID=UPI00163E1951|nr:phosphotransferase [Burkholderia gladioli]
MENYDSRFLEMTRWVEGEIKTQAISFEGPCSGASARKYYRVKLPANRTLIVMDAPPSQVDCSSYLRAARELGVDLAPEVLSFNANLGFMLLTDLGAKTLYDYLPADSDTVLNLYLKAIRGISDIQKLPTSSRVPIYGSEKLTSEMRDFLKNYATNPKLGEPTKRLDKCLVGSLDRLAAMCASHERVYAHFDYYSKNIIPVNDGVRLVDIQDACAASFVYDLASLLRDVNVCLPKFLHDSLLEQHWLNIKDRWKKITKDYFYESYYAMSLHRHLRILSTFSVLSRQPGKENYLLTFPLIKKYIKEECEILGDFKDINLAVALQTGATLNG